MPDLPVSGMPAPTGWAWRVIAIASLVLALAAAYFALTYRFSPRDRPNPNKCTVCTQLFHRCTNGGTNDACDIWLKYCADGDGCGASG